MIVLKSLGKNVKYYRKQADITQAELAERAGMHLSTIARLEIGAYCPKLETLDKIACALKTDIVNLFKNASSFTMTNDKEYAIRNLLIAVKELETDDINFFTETIRNYMKAKK